jgi:fumarate hydratase subunit beta
MEYELKTPIDKAELKKLKAGDTVKLTGTVYTARDAAHKRLIDLLDRGEPLPFELEGSVIYYVGPTPEAPGQVIGSAGPTTSGRMDAYSPRLLDLGQPVMIGKGMRNKTVVDAIVRNGAIYLAAMGGAGAVMGASIKQVKVICWEDLGCEAVRELQVENMPLTVAIDCNGGNIYESGPAEYLKSIRENGEK